MALSFRKEVEEAAARRLDGELIVSAPSYGWLISASLSVLTAALVGVAAFIPIPQKTTAKGWVGAEGGLFRLNAEKSGMLDAVYVHNGDRVSLGEKIARIRVSSDLPQGSDRQQMSIALDAELKAKLEELDSKEIGLTRDIAARQAQLRSAITVLTIANTKRSLSQQRLALDKKVLDAYLSLASDQTISTLELTNEQEKVLAAEGDLAEAETGAISAEQSIDQLRASLIDSQSELSQTNATITETKEQFRQRSASLASQDVYDLASPTTGVVGGVYAFPGEAVSPEQPVASLVRDGSYISASLYVPSSSVGLLKAGDQVILKFDAYPYRKFGIEKGFLSSVSKTGLLPDNLLSETSRNTDSIFLANVPIPDPILHSPDGQHSLRPGMRVTADIITGRRTLLGLLFAKLQQR